MPNSELLTEYQPLFSTPTFVLVEEDRLIRQLWRSIAQKKHIPLFIFDTPEAFLKKIETFNSQTRFYFDQDFLWRRGVGVSLAQQVKSRFKAYTCLVTSYPQSIFKTEIESGILDEVSHKFPWPFNPRDGSLTPKEYSESVFKGLNNSQEENL